MSQQLQGLDLPAVGARLAEVLGDERWRESTARLITGGKSNLTFRITSDAGSVILRRPPTGRILPKAHDMGREAKVQRGLADTDVPTAPILHEETTPDLIGAPFYVMGDVPGYVIRDETPAEFATDEGRQALAWRLADTLAALHNVDLERAGLTDYGRPEGFMARQVARWTKQWELAKDGDVPAVDELARRLAEDVPTAQADAIVHGDFRLDNCLVAPEQPPRVAAVLDWELSTLGDPLADLGMTLMYWSDPTDPIAQMVPSVTGEPGYPDRAALAERYAAGTGFDLAPLPYYEAFARLKFAAIAQGVSMRAKSGVMGDQEFADHGDVVPTLAEHGLAILDRR